MEEIVRISRVVTIHQFHLLPYAFDFLSLARSPREEPLMTLATPNQRLVLDTCDYVLPACEKEVLSMYLKIKRQRIIRYPGYISRQEFRFRRAFYRFGYSERIE